MNDKVMRDDSQEYKDKEKKHQRILALHELYSNRFVFLSFTLYGALILGLIFLIRYIVL